MLGMTLGVETARETVAIPLERRVRPSITFGTVI